MELVVKERFFNENSHNGHSILFPSCLQANCPVNYVLDSSQVHCGEVLKATWSGKLRDKCATVVFYVF